MTIYEILSQINREQERKVIVRWPVHPSISPPPAEKITKECWNVTITNEPDMYFQTMQQRYKGRATHCSQAEVESIEQGLELTRGLYNHFNSPLDDLEISQDIDSSKKIYLAIHIHYHLND